MSQVGVDGVAGQLATGAVPIAAMLMPAGLFLSVIGADPQRLNRLIALLRVGTIALTLGLLSAGIPILRAGLAA